MTARKPDPPKPLPMVGLFALLTNEQRVAALDVREDESFGPDDFRRPASLASRPGHNFPAPEV